MNAPAPYMCIYMHIYIYICLCTHIFIHVYIYIYMYISQYIYIYIYIEREICIRMYMYLILTHFLFVRAIYFILVGSLSFSPSVFLCSQKYEEMDRERQKEGGRQRKTQKERHTHLLVCSLCDTLPIAPHLLRRPYFFSMSHNVGPSAGPG